MSIPRVLSFPHVVSIKTINIFLNFFLLLLKFYVYFIDTEHLNFD